jgi:hypothetical protein
MDFEILIDESFLSITMDGELHPVENKHVLSLINDFEDGSWRYEKFQSFIWDNIAETALSHNERESLLDQSHSKLTAAAKNLRLTDKVEDVGSGSELAEIVLYGIMKHHYSALPVVPKIFYKQNVKDYAKGADSVHIVLEGEDDFSLWFGEAKFYNSIEDARLPRIVSSVKNSLKTEKLKKENSIITNVSDIDSLLINKKLRNKIKKSLLNKNSIDNIKSKIHIPILLLHECSITQRTNYLSDDYRQEVVAYHKERATSYFKKQISSLKSITLYEQIKFHIILFPIPEKETIVNRFLSNANHYSE